jgi:alpha-ketoglutaric semialdehyde dehydrogenase
MTALTDSIHRDHGLLIGGDWRPASSSFERHNPARPDQVVGTSAHGSPSDVADAYAAAAEAFAGWRATPAPTRGRILRIAGELIEQRVQSIATTLAFEEGKAIRDARGEVLRAAEIFRFHGAQGSQAFGEVYESAVATIAVQTIREPLGVVCVLTPWNFPIAIPAWKLAPALVYGNTVVWKPAEIASGTAAMLAQALVDAGLPDGVLNMVTGIGSELGASLLEAGPLAGVTFTGSNAVGRVVGMRAAERGIKAQLELGGKNASVVLADADLDRAAGCVTRSAMWSTGQRCTATSRAIVVRDVYDEFLSRLAAQCQALVVGDPLSDTTDVGPLASSAQFGKVTSYLELASREGLTPLLGGEYGDPAQGYFVAPTVYVDVDPGSAIAREEIFGPVVAVIAADDTQDAIRLANDTDYGLSGSIFTEDLRTALRCARELETGMVHLNGETAGAEPHIPFGGVKASSSGTREQGTAAREFFTELKTIYLENL